MVEMPRTSPGPERALLGFAVAAQETFSFLLGQGFTLMELSDTLARYESGWRIVRVFHGRASYELGVEVGRWVEVAGTRREQSFPLRDVVALRRDPVDVGFGGTTATSPPAVRRVMALLADWTREYAGPLVSGGDELFEVLSERNAERGRVEQEGLRAQRLRDRAEEAWRRRDFGAVALAYSEIESELHSVTLKASERGRLDYARKALGETA